MKRKAKKWLSCLITAAMVMSTGNVMASDFSDGAELLQTEENVKNDAVDITQVQTDVSDAEQGEKASVEENIFTDSEELFADNEELSNIIDTEADVPLAGATDLNSEIYLAQQGKTTCTLASAAMMIKSRFYKSNNDLWRSISEASIKSTAWIEGTGLRHSWTYKINGNSVSVKYCSMSGISVSSLKSLLNNHPEGIVLYCGKLPHAVFMTDYDGDTFYCADPLQSYSGRRMALSSSYLGKKYGSQADVLKNVTAYWYIDSYTISGNTPTPTPTIPQGSQTISDGRYYIATALDESKILEVSGNSKDNEGNVQLWSLADSKQAFDVTYLGNGAYKIISVNSGKSLDVAAAGMTAGTNVQQYDYVGADQQQWIIKDEGSGYYSIISRKNGLYLDVCDGGSDNMTNIQVWDGNGSAAQKWKFVKNNPFGCLDSVSPTPGKITVSGWAADMDEPDQPIDVHFYTVQGDKKVLLGGTTADKIRTDVHDANPSLGNYHGFSATFNTTLSGDVKIEAYGINTGNTGDNVMIGAKTVSVPKDTTKPVISNAKVSAVSASGYTVTCDVSDDVGVTEVKGPTWTKDNNQNDILWYKGNLSGNKVSFRVDVSNHKNRKNCWYYTDIYAYDAAGNSASYRLTTYVDATGPVISDVEITDISEKGYTVKCTVKDDHSQIDRVQFPSWFGNDNPYATDGSWQTSASVRGKLENGKYVYRVNTSDFKNQMGTYNTHIYAWDSCGNQSSPYVVQPTIKKHTHEYVASVKKAATCTEAGIMLYTCKENDNSYEETIPATGHQHTEVRDAKQATETQDGYTGDTYCKDCGEKLSSGEVIKKTGITAVLNASPSGSGFSGEQVELTASAEGGSGSYTYKFLICDDKGNWYKIRDYESGNTCTWVPGATGKKTLYVDVKDGRGTVKRAELSYEVKSKETPLEVKFTANPSISAVSGQQVRLIANANGGSGSYTYKFIICDAKGNWYKLRDYESGNICTWVPGAVGKKTLYVDAKDSKGTVKRAELSYEVKSKETPLEVKFTANPSTSAVSGQQVRLTANASGGNGSYTYKFIICDVKGNWYKLRDYESGNTCIWVPGAIGKKTLYVDAKDSRGTVKRAELSYEVRSKEMPLEVKFTANPSTSAVSGQQVRLTANASGGNGSYTYKFIICDAKGNWYKIRDYETDNTCIWVPGASGNKILYVDVKDSLGLVTRQSINFSVK